MKNTDKKLFPWVLFLALSLTLNWNSQAQTTAGDLLDAAGHPKFNIDLPDPAVIDATNGGTFKMEMAETNQWLGLYAEGTPQPPPPNATKLNTTVWGYGPERGTVTYPGPTFEAMENVGVDIQWANNLPNQHLLPIDQTLHWAAPPNYPKNGQPAVVHLHGGHTESASDGLPEAWYTRRWRDRGPTWAKKTFRYDNDQEAATLWYHDHALGITRLNVYAGLAGFYLLRDQNETALNGTVLPDGDYEREIVIQDRYFLEDGSLFLPSQSGDAWFGDPDEALDLPFAPSVVAEFFGDFIIVNGVAWPKLDVEETKYRFRMLNGSDSRVYNLKIQDANGALVPFFQIGTDNGLLPYPVPLDELLLAPGERADLMVDFSALTSLTPPFTMVNIGPDEPFKGGNFNTDVTRATGQIMRFNLVNGGNPPEFSVSAGTSLRPAISDLAQTGPTRKLALFEGADADGRLQPLLGIINGDAAKTPAVLNGSLAWFEPITENPVLNEVEVWEVYNATEDAHPIHLHLVSFQIINRQEFDAVVNPQNQPEHGGGVGTGGYIVDSSIELIGAPILPAANEEGWKDTFVVPPGQVGRVIAKFDRPGRYVWHCHILSHEDHEMMRPFEVVVSMPFGKPDPIVEEYQLDKATLGVNFPNPASSSTTIPFYLPADDNISLEVYDMSGKLVRILATGQHPAGNHLIEWDGANEAGSRISDGVYIYQLRTSEEAITQQMIIQRQ